MVEGSRGGPRSGSSLVVVGAGACGMVAALAAAKRGVEVLLLEKGAEPAGNTVRSTGLIPAAGTRFQREAGILDDTPELMAEDIFKKNDHESDPELTRLLCEESAPLVEWLADEVGCEMVCFTDFLYPGQSRLRKNSPVDDLIWDGKRVSGVETSDGVIEAGAVILALNGFGGNQEMVEEYLSP